MHFAKNLNNESPSTSGSDVPLSAQGILEDLFSRAYGAQLAWAQTSVRERVSKLSKLRGLLVRYRKELASLISVPQRQGYLETVTSEILPLADATRWLQRRAHKVLQPRYCHKRHTPLWLGVLQSTVYRVPYGLVLIIGAGNYPLFLTGVQVLQAIAAGNAVAIKPAPGAEKVTQRFVQLLAEAGVPKDLVLILDSTIEAAKLAIDTGVDKVVMTGSSRSGRAVLKQLADSVTPAIMELSGCDAVYVLPGADMHRVCDVLMFGLRLNGGATCMAPRRVFVPRKCSEVFHRLLTQRLQSELQRGWKTSIPRSTFEKLRDGLDDALQRGARLLESENLLLRDSLSDSGGSPYVSMGHLVLRDVKPESNLCCADIFAPLLMIIPVEDWTETIQSDSVCPYALTVSIYGPVEDALRITKYVSAGVILINDTIVPTADPQLPFGGRGESGFGVTRGDEGLLGMTVPKVVSLRRGNWLPHSKPPTPVDAALLDGLLQCLHAGSWKERFIGMQQVFKTALRASKKPK